MKSLDGIIPVRVRGAQSLRNESASWNTAFASHQSTVKSASHEGTLGGYSASQSESRVCKKVRPPLFLLWVLKPKQGLWDKALDLLNS